jgi:hypothetical protein
MSVAKSRATRWGQLALKGMASALNRISKRIVSWASKGYPGLSVRRILSAKTALHDSGSLR